MAGKSSSRIPEILYEDDSIIVCHKPAGMPTETARAREMDLVSYLKNVRAQRGQEPYVGLVTRLDQPVEGLIVCGLTQKAAAALSASQQAGKWTKRYEALVRGSVPEGTHRLEDYLLRDGRTNTSKVVQKGTKGAKRAALVWECLESGPEASRIRVTLETGRHHQIRVQMAHAGYPLLGDRKYGSNVMTAENRKTAYDLTGENGPKANAGGLSAAENRAFPALCAVFLEFPHPKTGEMVSFHTRPNF